MPSNQDDQTIYGGRGEEEEEEEVDDEESEEDGDIEEDEEDDEDLTIHQPEDEVEEEEDLNSASPSTFSSSDLVVENPSTVTIAVSTPTSTATVAAAPNGSVVETPAAVAVSSPDHKRQRTSEISAVAIEEKKPSAFDDSRRLFQRLWTDEDEIGLLQGFLEFTMQRRSQNSSHHHDTGPFYDQIKTRLQLDFNKNQLVEKLRRLKKKYRNVVSRFSSGKDSSFKSPHDQATFEISRKIWSNPSVGGGGVEEAGLEDEEGNPQNNNKDDNKTNTNHSIDANSGKKESRSRRRSRKRAAEDNISNYQATSSAPNIIEDTVRSCLSPLFKELLYCAINGPGNTGGYGGVTLNPLPLNFGGNTMNVSRGEVVDEKWRKQQILELEVYSKRIELVQDQIKTALEDLRSMGS